MQESSDKSHRSFFTEVGKAAQDVYEFTQKNGLDIDILINNAGFGDAGPFAYSGWKKQYNMVQVNTTRPRNSSEVSQRLLLRR